jgi:glycerol uptake operon antiterminator
VVSSNARFLAQARDFDLETIQRIFAVDSTGLEVALASVDRQYVDLLDIAPALAIPYAVAQIPRDLPFIGTGFIHTPQQMQQVLRAGALGVAVSSPELWP